MSQSPASNRTASDAAPTNNPPSNDPSSDAAAQLSAAEPAAGGGGGPLAGALDGMTLTALMSSRLCHDLVNPVGALSSGLEVLNDDDMDEDMRAEAMSLVQSSTEKTVAALKYARLAYGMAGGYDRDVSLEEARDLLIGVYAFSKADLIWNVTALAAPKDHVKGLLLLAHAAADSVPRGGTVTVSGDKGVFLIEATGARVMMNDDVPKALAGDIDDLKPKHTPLYVAGLMARRSGGKAAAAFDGERVRLALQFGNAPTSDADLS
ncbi:MAG: histidine phosphotransferase family protein [Pseudomonadota bacterium]